MPILVISNAMKNPRHFTNREGQYFCDMRLGCAVAGPNRDAMGLLGRDTNIERVRAARPGDLVKIDLLDGVVMALRI